MSLVIDLGPHGSFILLSYIAMGLTLFGLAAWLLVDGQRQKRRLQDLEHRNNAKSAKADLKKV
jgi:heme exporter protein CcmD